MPITHPLVQKEPGRSWLPGRQWGWGRGDWAHRRLGRGAELGPPWMGRGHVGRASEDATVGPSWARLGTVRPRSIADWG